MLYMIGRLVDFLKLLLLLLFIFFFLYVATTATIACIVVGLQLYFGFFSSFCLDYDKNIDLFCGEIERQ